MSAPASSSPPWVIAPTWGRKKKAWAMKSPANGSCRISSRRPGILFYWGKTQVFTNFTSKDVNNLVMTWDSRPLILDRIVPPRMTAPSHNKTQPFSVDNAADRRASWSDRFFLVILTGGLEGIPTVEF